MIKYIRAIFLVGTNDTYICAGPSHGGENVLYMCVVEVDISVQFHRFIHRRRDVSEVASGARGFSFEEIDPAGFFSFSQQQQQQVGGATGTSLLLWAILGTDIICMLLPTPGLFVQYGKLTVNGPLSCITPSNIQIDR